VEKEARSTIHRDESNQRQMPTYAAPTMSQRAKVRQKSMVELDLSPARACVQEVTKLTRNFSAANFVGRTSIV